MVEPDGELGFRKNEFPQFGLDSAAYKFYSVGQAAERFVDVHSSNDAGH